MSINNNKPILLRTKNQIYDKIMIKSLSPYYFTTPWNGSLSGDTATSYTIQLYIWSGDKISIPTTPQYSLTKKNIANSVGVDELNVSRLVNDFIDFTPTITVGFIASQNQRWVHKEIIYTTGNPIDDGVKRLAETILASKGYTYGNEGKNAQPPADLVYATSREVKVHRTSTIWSVPLKIESGVGSVIVQSFPNNEINYAYDTSANLDFSFNQVRLVNVDVKQAITDKYILITYNGVEIYAGIFDEYKYEPVNIYYLNKEGEQQSVTFFKERKDSMSVTKQTYENDRAQPSTGAHQYVDLNVQARTGFTASSGFVNEQLNEEFKQLLLSTKVYTLQDGTLLPANVSTKNIEYKTRVNERLINYVINFKYSYNEINNI